MPLCRLLIAAAVAITNSAFANPVSVAVSPSTTVRQADGSYVLGGLALAPGQWRIQEAPSGPSTCCDGYRLISDANSQLASFTLNDKLLRFTSFQVVVQFNDSPSEINNIWGWVNAYSAGNLVSSDYFGGHYWSEINDRQTVSAIIPSSVDRIEIAPRTNLGFTAFSYSVSAVPEPSNAALFACGIAICGLFARTRLQRNGAAYV